jgi:hypothetical protein
MTKKCHEILTWGFKFNKFVHIGSNLLNVGMWFQLLVILSTQISNICSTSTHITNYGSMCVWISNFGSMCVWISNFGSMCVWISNFDIMSPQILKFDNILSAHPHIISKQNQRIHIFTHCHQVQYYKSTHSTTSSILQVHTLYHKFKATQTHTRHKYYKSMTILIFLDLIGRLLLVFLDGLSSVVPTTSFPLFLFLCSEQTKWIILSRQLHIKIKQTWKRTIPCMCNIRRLI